MQRISAVVHTGESHAAAILRLYVLSLHLQAVAQRAVILAVKEQPPAGLALIWPYCAACMPAAAPQLLRREG
jgi:hypothetical protein